MLVKAVVVLYKFEYKGKAQAANVVFLCGSIFFAVRYTFSLFRWRVAELPPENFRKVRQVFETDFKTSIAGVARQETV
jgi:hypothetical protein